MNANTNSASLLAPVGSEANHNVSDSVDWEACYQKNDTPWEKGEAAPPLMEFLDRHQIQGEILVPGSGFGHDVRAIAARSKENKVLGLDLSPSAVERARAIPVVGNESYEVGDLFKLPASWYGRFDWVVEHTCFCAIPPSMRDTYVRAIAEVLRPGGYFFAIFFINPGVEAGPPFEVSREELAHFFDPEFELLEEWLPGRTFAGREGRELCQLRQRKS